MLPDHPGSYVLILYLSRPAVIRVGDAGRFRFPPGWYAYAGSARGPGGLASRLARHLHSSKRLHWHMDYLRRRARPVEIWYAVGPQERECAWAQALAALPGASLPVPHFGATDCRCPAHLARFAAPPDGVAFARAVGEPVTRVAEELLERVGEGETLFEP